MKPLDELRPHPLNKEIYGSPKDNTAYPKIKASMSQIGWDPSEPLLVTPDGRIIRGVTRWAVGRSLKTIPQAPCIIFEASSPETAEQEYEWELLTGNDYREKTQEMIAREQRRLVEVQKILARKRMASGSDGGLSKSTQRVGKLLGVSNKTIERNIKIINAIDQCRDQREHTKAEKLTEYLNTRKTTKALGMLEDKPKSPKPTPADDADAGGDPPSQPRFQGMQTFSSTGEVNAFHQLPRAVQDDLLALLEHSEHLEEQPLAFVHTWLTRDYPNSGKGCRKLRRELLEQRQKRDDDEAHDDRLGPVDKPHQPSETVQKRLEDHMQQLGFVKGKKK
jgi:hypothetical protein